MTANVYTSPKKKVLVADNDLTIIRTIFKYFESTNEPYELCKAYSGALTYQMALEEIPDLIIIDWEMAMLSGLEVITYLKKLKETQDIPVIITSALQMQAYDLKEALNQGAADYVRKPLNKVELLARARAAIRLAEMQKQQKQHLQTIIDTKNRELSTIVMQVAQKNQVLSETEKKLRPLTAQNTCLRKLLKTIQDNLRFDDQWEKFKLHFEQVHPHFFVNLQKTYKTLTPNELKLCAYIKMNLSHKEILQILNISTKGLETARYRIKKKLNLGAKNDLNKFIQQL